MRQNDDIALRPQWPSLLSVVSRAHMLRSSLQSNWTNFKSLHNNHTNLYDCRRNKFYMIADVTNFAWLQKKRINFNTRWKHDNSSNKQLWPRWWRAPTWSTPQSALVMALVRFGNWRWLGWWCFFSSRHTAKSCLLNDWTEESTPTSILLRNC